METANLPPIHPALVHFPIALIGASFLCDLLARLMRNATLYSAGWWTLVLGTVSMALTIPAGYYDMERLTLNSETHEYVDLHMQIGWVVFIAAAGLTLWRAVYRTSFERPVGIGYFVAAVLVVGITFFQGWYGGEMVYAHGAGVAAAGQGTQSPEAAKRPLEVVSKKLNRLPGIRFSEHRHEGPGETTEPAGAKTPEESHEH